MAHVLNLILLILIFYAVKMDWLGFAALLLLASTVTGVVAFADIVYFAKRRTAQKPMPKIIEFSRSYFPMLISVLLLRSFIIEPFRIPSGSLEPTLMVGDFVAVNKFAYGLRLPVWDKEIISVGLPKIGDIAVFRWPPDPTLDYIKRVVGGPGDVVMYEHKQLTINGKLIPQNFIGYETDESSGKAVAKYEETINGVTHDIYIRPDAPDTDFKVTVPAGHYFMLGDNRDDSADSRYWGLVAQEYLRGKAFLIWMSWDGGKDRIRFNRIGRFIR